MTASGEERWGASGVGGVVEESSSSSGEEEEEELPPGDRVAYIHVGEGGEADLEAQLKGKFFLPFRITCTE